MIFATQFGVQWLRRVLATAIMSVLLAPFAFAAAVAAGGNDMKGMSCCKNGKDSCCRRKAMNNGKPALRADNPCAVPCLGQPGVVTSMATPPPDLHASPEMVEQAIALSVEPNQARRSAGIDLRLFQRPPPKS